MAPSHLLTLPFGLGAVWARGRALNRARETTDLPPPPPRCSRASGLFMKQLTDSCGGKTKDALRYERHAAKADK